MNDLDKQVSVRELIQLASNLKSDDGENLEYDRALVELISDAVYSAGDEPTYNAIRKLVGVKQRRIS